MRSPSFLFHLFTHSFRSPSLEKSPRTLSIPQPRRERVICQHIISATTPFLLSNHDIRILRNGQLHA